LSGAKSGTSELFIDNLPGMPDNIRLQSNGDLWAPLSAARCGRIKNNCFHSHRFEGGNNVLDKSSTYPRIRNHIAQLVPAKCVGVRRYNLMFYRIDEF
jgi:hypothetical protein